MSAPPLMWKPGDRCYVRGRGLGLVSHVTEAGVSVMFESGRVGVVERDRVQLSVESPTNKVRLCGKMDRLTTGDVGGGGGGWNGTVATAPSLHAMNVVAMTKASVRDAEIGPKASAVTSARRMSSS